MDRKRPQKSIISTGVTSFVLIFVMLSLLTFSVLSLSSAQANLRLSRKSAERTTAYYTAENEANDLLDGLLQARDSGPEALTGYASDHDMTVSDTGYAYRVALGEDQSLAVAVRLTDDSYEVLSWQVVSDYEWAPDGTLNLMGTGSMPLVLED